MTAYAEQPLSEIVRNMALLDKLLYIRKPFASEEIQQIALSLVTKWNVERELARQRQELGVSHRRLEAVLNATGDAIAMYDTADQLVFANRWYQELVDPGGSQAYVAGKRSRPTSKSGFASHGCRWRWKSMSWTRAATSW